MFLSFLRVAEVFVEMFLNAGKMGLTECSVPRFVAGSSSLVCLY